MIKLSRKNLSVKWQKNLRCCENQFDGIIAIGNKFATPAWIKSISLINCGKLDAFIDWVK